MVGRTWLLVIADGIFLTTPEHIERAVPSDAGFPETFGRYQLLQLIAKGGMAEVFKARIATLGGTEKIVCIKRILPHLSENSEFVALFAEEAQIVLPLTHGNITQVFDFGQENRLYYLAMEYVHGVNLAQALRRLREVRTKLDLATTLFIAIEVAKGLAFAHSGGGRTDTMVPVIHRDVTPQNILLSYSGQVKLTDFGIALALERAMPAVDSQVLRGKPTYVAPEQLLGQHGDSRTDIYSLGIVIYEMLTGDKPYNTNSDAVSLLKDKSRDLPPPSSVNPEVDPELDQIVAKAAAFAPERRFESAAELQVALSKIFYRKYSEYTAESLQAVIVDLFAWEIAQEDDVHRERIPRDRLLFQLAKAGISVSPDQPVERLLQLGTVVMSPVDASAVVRKKRWVRGGSAALLLSLAVLLIMVPLLISRDSPPTRGASASSMRPDLEHLVTPSFWTPPPPPIESPSPASSSAKNPAAARGPRGEVAYLNINSWPWSHVYVNGKRLPGNTPFFRVPVKAGDHQIRMVRPGRSEARDIHVVVAAGDEITLAVNLEQGGKR